MKANAKKRQSQGTGRAASMMPPITAVSSKPPYQNGGFLQSIQKMLCLSAALLAAGWLAAEPACNGGAEIGKSGKRYSIFILGGQSNMAGRGTLRADNRVSTERVLKFTRDMKWEEATEPLHFDKKAAGAGLAASFARIIADRDPETVVAIVPCAFGGSPIRDWQPGRVHYTNLVARARAAMKDGEIKGFLWHQGCNDAFSLKHIDGYLPLFTNAITSIRRELGIEDKPFLAGELGPYLVAWKDERRPNIYWREINKKIAEGVKLMPNAALVSANRLFDVKKDRIHFETPSLRRFGERYATAYLDLILGKLDVKVESDRADFVYGVGEEAAFTVTVTNPGRDNPHVGKVKAWVDNFGKTKIEPERTFDFGPSGTFTIRAKMNEPGFMRLCVLTDDGRTKMRGVAVAPRKIAPGRPAPADLEKFWSDAVAAYDAAVPEDVKMEPLPALDTPTREAFKVSLAAPFGRRMWGTLAIPRDRSRRHPLHLNVPGAGPARWSVGGKDDEAYLMMNVHYYEPVAGGAYPENQPLQTVEDREWEKLYGVDRYCKAGISKDRESYFYYSAILGIRRAFIWATKQDWADPSDVTYAGTSQGGGFGLFMTALVPGVRKSVIYVPAITGHYASELGGAQDGWPLLIEGQKDDAAREAARKWAGYFDGASFATMVKTPVRFVVGFADTTCAPHAVYSAYNMCPAADKAIWHGLDMSHSVYGDLYRRGDEWRRKKE